MLEIIITFEGTEPLSITDWIDDLEDTKIDYPLSSCNTTPRCQVHKGFYNTYNTIRLDLWKTVTEYLDYFGHKTPVHITGHSLGSALATHCALGIFILHTIIFIIIYAYNYIFRWDFKL